MAWLFHGNPKRFDIDDYLSRYPQCIYWRTNRYAQKIAVGDRAFIWRAGPEAGAVAVGQVIEAPTPAHLVKHPEALGDDLWASDEANPAELKTGIRLDDIRLNRVQGMVPRQMLQADPLLHSAAIIAVPNGTVFCLSEPEEAALMSLWQDTQAPLLSAGAIEGQPSLRAHYIRERSPRLRHDKLHAFRQTHAKLCCEICGFETSTHHPEPFKDRAFEVHHKRPLASAATPVRTTLDDLTVLCANCHRAVHASANVTQNYAALVNLYAAER